MQGIPMIDVTREKPIPLADVCTMFPGRTGKGLARSTPFRWAMVGRRGKKLESIIVGGQRYTSREAVARWIVALNEMQDSSETREDEQEVEKELDEILNQ